MDEINVMNIATMIAEHGGVDAPVVHGLLRQGEIMNLIGAPKTGKSWLAEDMAFAVAMGTDWLGMPVERGRALILDNELTPKVKTSRIKHIANERGVDIDDIGDDIHVACLRGKNTNVALLDRYLYKLNPGLYNIIILDSLYQFIIGISENDNGYMARIYNTICRHAGRLQCGFVIVHHTSKGVQSYKSVSDVGSGAGAMSRAADSHMVIRPHAENGVFVVDSVTRSWPAMPAFCIKMENMIAQLAPDHDPANLQRPARRRRRTKQKKEIWTPELFAKAFVPTEPTTREAIIAWAAEKEISDYKARNLLKQAEELGIIVRTSDTVNEKAAFKLK